MLSPLGPLFASETHGMCPLKYHRVRTIQTVQCFIGRENGDKKIEAVAEIAVSSPPQAVTVC